MSQENQITLRGYLTAEPKFFQKSPEATPMTEIRVGCTPRRLNRESGEWQDMPTSYYKVKCWRRLAINTASSLHKGDQVIIRGHFFMTNWVDSQQRPRSALEIEADTIGHDLAYGWSHFMRGTRPSGSKEGVNSGEMARQNTGTQGSGTQGSGTQGSEAQGSGAQGSGDGGDEYGPDLEASGPDESPDSQRGWDADVRASAGQGGQEAEAVAGWDGDSGPHGGDGAAGGELDGGWGTRSVTSDAGATPEDVTALERQPVPF
jgi:single-strand DNA-binding protein